MKDEYIKQEALKKFALDDEMLEGITGGTASEIPDWVQKMMENLDTDLIAESALS